MSKWARGIGIATLGLAVFTSLIGCAYLQQPQFGALPGGTRLQAIERSPHYVDGEFRNVIDTPMRTQDSSFASNLMLMLFDRNPKLRPSAPLPFTRVDFTTLSPNEDVVVCRRASKSTQVCALMDDPGWATAQGWAARGQV